MSAEALEHVWTLDEYMQLDLPELEGHKIELFDGLLLVTPPPIVLHQYVGGELAAALRLAAPADVVPMQDTGVLLPSGVLIPDVLVAPREVRRERLIPPAAVLLVIEVESPSTRRRDRMIKAAAYAEAGIPLYWRIEWDGQRRPVVIVNELVGKDYKETARLLPGTTATLDRPFPVSFDPADLG